MHRDASEDALLRLTIKMMATRMIAMGDLRRGDRRAPYSTFTSTALRCVLLLQQVETSHKLTEIHLTGKEWTENRQGRRRLPLGHKAALAKGDGRRRCK
jgi:hypothetical protein